MSNQYGFMALPKHLGGSGVKTCEALCGKEQFEDLITGGLCLTYGENSDPAKPSIPSARRQDAFMNENLSIIACANLEYDPSKCDNVKNAIQEMINNSTSSDVIVQAICNDADAIADLKAKIDDNTTYVLSAPQSDGNGNCITTLTGTLNGSVVSTEQITVAKPILESDGVHLSGEPSFNSTTNIFTFNLVNDADESSAGTVEVDLSSLVSNPLLVTGGGSVTATYNAGTGQLMITGTDNDTIGSVTDNGDGTFDFNDGNGNITVIRGSDTELFQDGTNETISVPTNCVQPSLTDLCGDLVPKDAAVYVQGQAPIEVIRIIPGASFFGNSGNLIAPSQEQELVNDTNILSWTNETCVTYRAVINVVPRHRISLSQEIQDDQTHNVVMGLISRVSWSGTDVVSGASESQLERWDGAVFTTNETIDYNESNNSQVATVQPGATIVFSRSVLWTNESALQPFSVIANGPGATITFFPII